MMELGGSTISSSTITNNFTLLQDYPKNPHLALLTNPLPLTPLPPKSSKICLEIQSKKTKTAPTTTTTNLKVVVEVIDILRSWCRGGRRVVTQNLKPRALNFLRLQMSQSQMIVFKTKTKTKPTMTNSLSKMTP